MSGAEATDGEPDPDSLELLQVGLDATVTAKEDALGKLQQQRRRRQARRREYTPHRVHETGVPELAGGYVHPDIPPRLRGPPAGPPPRIPPPPPPHPTPPPPPVPPLLL